MRTSRSPACGAARLGIATLLFTASSALATPAKGPKPRHASAPTSSSAASAATELRHDTPAAPPDAKAPPIAGTPAPAPPTALVVPSRDAALTTDANAPFDPDPQTALEQDDSAARQETARVAAGRVEVAISGGLDLGRRHFTYSDPVGRLLAPYHLNAVPMVSVGLEAYPLASTNLPVLRDLGFRGRYSRAFAVNSDTPDGATLNTDWRRFGGEVRERLLVFGAHPLELGAYVGAEASYFDLSTKNKVAAFPPRARTISIRYGLDARLYVAWRLSALLSAAYLHTTERGEIYNRFRDPKVNGVDAEVGCAVDVRPGLEARVIGRYTRYFATFQPKLGDLAVAGGALDEQVQFGLGARYAH